MVKGFLFVLALLLTSSIILTSCSQTQPNIEKEETKEKAAVKEQKSPEEQVKAEKEEQETQADSEQQNEDLAKRWGLELITVGRVVDGDTIVTSDGRKIHRNLIIVRRHHQVKALQEEQLQGVNQLVKQNPSKIVLK